MISHLGPHGASGHYISHCWLGGDRYAIYDDGVVRETTWRYFLTEASERQVYVLAYVRVGFWGDTASDGSEETPYARDPSSLSVAEARKQWMADEAQAGPTAQVHSSSPAASGIARPDAANAASSAATSKAGNKPSATSDEVGSGSLSSPVRPADASLPEPPPAKKAKHGKNHVEAEARPREEAPQGPFVEGAFVTCSKGHALVRRNVGPSRKAGFETHCDRCHVAIKSRCYRCDDCSDDGKEDFCEACVRRTAEATSLNVAKRARKAQGQ